MSDETERDAVRAEFYARHHHEFRTLAAVRAAVRDAMADEIVRLRDENAALRAAVERVRALHVGKQAFYPNWDGAVICQTCNKLFPCPTLRALEGTP